MAAAHSAVIAVLAVVVGRGKKEGRKEGEEEEEEEEGEDCSLPRVVYCLSVIHAEISVVLCKYSISPPLMVP